MTLATAASIPRLPSFAMTTASKFIYTSRQRFLHLFLPSTELQSNTLLPAELALHL